MSISNDNQKRLNLRSDIYFALNLKQQRKINLEYSWHCIESMPMNEFKKITKSKRLETKLIELKRNCILLAA